MQLGEITKADGWNTVQSAVRRVFFRKDVYCFFAINHLDPVSLGLNPEQNAPAISSTTKKPAPNEIKEAWKSFMEKVAMNKDLPFYAVYDFGYYVNEDTFRSSIILISYIPDGCKNLVKMVYSTNVQAIKDTLEIPFLLEVQNEDEITYDGIQDLVSRIQIAY
ncbi:COFI [Enterospora canceri]|uniref:COFI n=1 Tax=Enterospora canceri TaxID=1081671 RepID=A0A1Y1S7T6_9MICR|nr:COFI [Enterospora canceri]